MWQTLKGGGRGEVGGDCLQGEGSSKDVGVGGRGSRAQSLGEDFLMFLENEKNIN